MLESSSWASLRPATLKDLAVLAASAAVTVALMFLTWEGIEQLVPTGEAALRAVHYARGISTSFVTATVIGFVAIRQMRRRASLLEAEVRHRTGDAEEARALLQLIVDTTPAGLILIGADHRVLQANRTAQIVHGATLAGLPCSEALRGACGPCTSCAVAQEPPATRRFLVTEARTGEVVEMESHAVRLPSGERYTLLVERILTEQKKLQARLVHQEKMAAFGLLAAGIAHDLGNPLSSIAVQLQLLDDYELTEESKEVVETVRGEVARLQRILRELVDFARRRRDEAALVSAERAVRDALTLVRHDPRSRRIETHVDADPETPSVFMVEDHLVQVVLNLVLNALDAMAGGGKLTIEILPAADEVAVRVHDTGTGMDRPTMARAFEPLFTTKAPGKGTGLGLSVCRDIVEAAGGRIELHSTRGQGTTVVLTLPAAVEVTAALAPNSAAEAA